MAKISVVVVTKNRVLELSQLLGSLLANTQLPDEIVVIDNNSSDQTRQLALGLTQNCKVKIKYNQFVGSGYPKIYNQALKMASGDWVAVIDDDCVADQNWVKELKKTIAKKNCEVVMGWCETFYSDNVYSQATLVFDNDWKERALDGNQVLDFEVLDNKNVAYNVGFLKKHLLQYDEQRVTIEQGAAEDCDLGIQIQEVGGRAICNRQMLVWHKDPQDWKWLMKKTSSSWRAYQSLSLKWPMEERAKLKKPDRPLLALVKDASIKWKLSPWQKLKLFLVLKQVLLWQRVLPILELWRHQ